MTIILLKELRAEASRLRIPGRSKMNRGDLIEAIAVETERLRVEGKREAVETLRETLSDPRMVEAIAGDVPAVRAPDVSSVAAVSSLVPGQASCVDCREVFNVYDTEQCATCHPKVTPATVFGGMPRTKFKVTRTAMRRANVRNRRK